jgi:hypothetical protein
LRKDGAANIQTRRQATFFSMTTGADDLTSSLGTPNSARAVVYNRSTS